MVKSRTLNLKLVVLVFVLCYAVAGIIEKANRYRDMEEMLKTREELRPLGEIDSQSYPVSVIDYFKFYGLDFEGEGLEHIFGTFESGGQILVGHIYKPENYKATVLVLHGYFDHCGQLNHLIKYLLDAGFVVAAFDLPGLGLSSGERGAIDDFAQYSQSLVDFADEVKMHLRGPYYFVGHSTGAAAALDCLFKNENTVFERIILTAPLIHCAGWEQTKIGYNEKIKFVKSVPRIFRKNSSDADFLKFIKKKDPLQSRIIPLKWVRALHKWNERIANLPGCEKNVKIIQGVRDTTIDWRFNIKFIKEKLGDVEVSLIENARHELFNESEDIRNEVFLQIRSYLEN